LHRVNREIECDAAIINRLVLARITDAIAVTVGLITIGNGRAIVAAIADLILIPIHLIRVGHIRTIVPIITDAIAVTVSLRMDDRPREMEG
jgi:hypothetical protein